ncbi:MAG: PKD domain-containing protein [Thermoplasmata archaeon]
MAATPFTTADSNDMVIGLLGTESTGGAVSSSASIINQVGTTNTTAAALNGPPTSTTGSQGLTATLASPADWAFIQDAVVQKVETTTPSPVPISGLIDVGQSVNFTTNASGGTGGYTYTWTQSDPNFGCTLGTTNLTTCTPTGAGTYTVSVFATDSSSVTSSIKISANFVVYALPVTTPPSPSPGSVDAGQSVTFSTSTTLGAPGTDTYAWTTPVGLACAASITNSITCPNPAAGTYDVSVNATDSNGGVSASQTLSSFVVYSVPVTTSTPSPSPTSGLIDVGQTVTFTTSAGGGSGGYTYAWTQSDSDFGCNLASTVDTIACTPTVAGPYTVSVAATDTNGVSSATGTSASFVVDTVPTVTTPNPSIASTGIDVGQSVTFTTSASGGSGGYTFAWTQSDPNFGCVLGATDTITCTPTVAGSYTVSVNATDSNGATSATVTSSSYVVDTSPTATTPSPSLASGHIDVGQAVTFTTSASGGSGGYTYAWTQSSSNFGCVLGATHTITCTPTVAGTYTVSVNATDSNGGISTTVTSASYLVHTVPVTTTPAPSIASSGIDVGQTVTFTTSASGGRGGYTFTWTQSDANFGCNVASTTTTMACTPTVAGTYTVSVFATDSNGVSSATETSASFVVDTVPTVTTPNPSIASTGIDVGQSVTFTTSASGGSGGYTFVWTQSDPNFGCVLGATDTVTCTPTVAGSYTVSVNSTDSNGGSSTTVASASFTVDTLPTATTPAPSPASTHIDVGQSVTFTTSASGGSGGYTFTWTQSSPNFGCVLGATDTITCTPTVASTYTVSVYATDSNGGISTTVNSANYVVDTVPVATAPSASIASGGIDVGQSVTYTTSTSGGSGGYTYTWTQSDPNFGCNVASTIATMVCTPTVAGTYTVSVHATDSNGKHSTTVTSSSFTVETIPAVTVPNPSLASGHIDVGQSVTFTTSASGGSGGYTFTWVQSSGNFGCDLASTIATMSCTPTVAGTYTVSVFATDTNGGDSTTVASAGFTVDALPTTTTPTPSPISAHVDVGQSVTFTTSTSGGSGGFTYTWTQSSGNFGCNVASTITTIVCTPTLAGTYTVSVFAIDSNGGHSTTVASANFVVDTLPTVTVPGPSKASGGIDVGQSVTFTTSASGGSGGYSYAWIQSSVNFGCNIASTVTTMSCTPTVAGTYTVSVFATDSNGGDSTTVASSNYIVDTIPSLTAPSPSAASGHIDVGQSVTFTTTPSGGSGGYSYTWTQSNANFGCNVASTGATMACTPTAAGSYTVSVHAADSNGGTSTTVTSASFTVDSLPAATTPGPSPASAHIDVGQSVTFTSSASGGSGGYTYTWTQSSGNFGCNLASSVDTISCIPTIAGSYTVSVFATDSNGGNSPTVASASYVVDTIPTVTAPGPSVASGGIDVGQSVTFTTSVSGGSGGTTYTWTQSSVNFGCDVASTVATMSCTPTVAGTYTVSVFATDTNGGDSTTVPSSSFTVDSLPATTTPGPSLASAHIDVGQSVTFTTSASGGSGGFTYTWTQSSGSFGCNVASTSTTMVCTPTLAGTYTVSVFAVDSNGGHSTTVASANFVVDTLPTVTVPGPSVSSGGIDVSQSVTFTTSASGGRAGYTYTWTQSSANFGCNLASTTSTVSCTPTVAGTYTVSVFAADANGGQSTTIASASYVVDTIPSVTVPGPSISSGGIDVGQSVTFTTTPSGGNGGYTFTWTQSSGNFGCNVASTIASITCIPTVAGTYTVSVFAVDTNGGNSATVASSSFTVDTLPTVAVPSPSVSSGSIDVGQSLTFTTSASGGSGGYTFTWTESSGNFGCNLASSVSTISCTPTVAGSYTVSVFATDTNSVASATQTSASFVVDTLPTVTTPSPSPTSAHIDVGQSVTFTTSVSGGSGGTTFTWTQSSANFGCNLAATTTTMSCIPTVAGTYTVSVFATDSNDGTSAVLTSANYVVDTLPAVTTPAPSLASGHVDVGQSVTFTTSASGGSGGYTYTWTQTSGNFGCNVASTTDTLACTPTVAGTYTVSVHTTDSNGGLSTTVASSSFTVDTLPTATTPAPSVASDHLDVGQPVTFTTSASGGSGGFTYTWTQSSANLGCNLASTAATMACTPTIGGTYTVSVFAIDSNGGHSVTVASSNYIVNSALTAPAAPTPSVTSLDADQAMTVTGTLASTGTTPYSWQWMVSVNGGTYGSAATFCTMSGGSGASGGTMETCAIPGNSLSASTSYNFRLQVTDSATTEQVVLSAASATITTSSALTAGTPTPTISVLDNGQSITLTANPSGGSTLYTAFQWYSGASGPACLSLSSPIGGAVSSTYLAAPTTPTYYCYNVTDSNSDNATSAVTEVTVNTALTAPATPTVSATLLDADQPLTVHGTIPTTGTPTYSWQWLVSINAGTDVASTVCVVNSGVGATGAAAETCLIPAHTLVAGDTYGFELQVTDSATNPETVISTTSSTATVSSALATPATPTPSAAKLDVNQALVVSGTIPTTGTSTYAWQWLIAVNGGGFVDATQCAANSGIGASSGVPETCSVAASALTVGDTYSFSLMVTDSATTPETQSSAGSSTVAVSSALTPAGTPTISAPALDADQVLTVTGTLPSTGTSSYSWQWLVSVNGGGYSTAVECTVASGGGATAGATEACTVSSGTLTAGDSYSFELKVTDGASAPETQKSFASSGVSVSTALTAPVKPALSATGLDADQALTVTGSTPTNGTASYSWLWLSSVNGGAFADATQCAVGSGSGASGGAAENCVIAANTLVVKDNYAFQLEVTDSASTPEVATSSATSTLTVNSALTGASAPTASAAMLDVNQALTVMGTIPSTGTPTYSWHWLFAVNGGSFSVAAVCTVSSGAGATSGATESCAIAPNLLTAGSTYTFELRISDSASAAETATSGSSSAVVANSALSVSTPTPSSPTLDAGQSITLTATASGGASGYGYQWYSGASASACNSLGSPLSGATSATYLATPTSTTYYCYTATDSASTPETSSASAAVAVTVNPALTAPTPPASSATQLNNNQALTITGTIPSSGTPDYAWQWLVSVNGGGFDSATQCAVNGGTGAAAGATETCTIPANTLTSGDTYSFQLQVTDGASSPVTTTSAATPAVSVTSPSSSSSLWIYLVIAVVVLLALILVALVVLRRRRPRPAAAPPMQVWQEEPSPPMGAPIGPAPDYLEMPEDVGHAGPSLVPVPTGGVPVTPPVPPPGAEGEPDIDALMAELDKISGEILKKPSKVPKDAEGEDLSEEEEKSS